MKPQNALPLLPQSLKDPRNCRQGRFISPCELCQMGLLAVVACSIHDVLTIRQIARWIDSQQVRSGRVGGRVAGTRGRPVCGHLGVLVQEIFHRAFIHLQGIHKVLRIARNPQRVAAAELTLRGLQLACTRTAPHSSVARACGLITACHAAAAAAWQASTAAAADAKLFHLAQ